MWLDWAIFKEDNVRTYKNAFIKGGLLVNKAKEMKYKSNISVIV